LNYVTFCSSSFVASQLALKSMNLEFDFRQGKEVIAFFKNTLNGCGVHADSTIVTRTRRHRTNKPDEKPLLCQRTFTSVFRAVF